MKMKPLSSKSVAHLLDLSPDDVIELSRKGRLKGRKKGRFWRYNLSDVLQYRKLTGDVKKGGG